MYFLHAQQIRQTIGDTSSGPIVSNASGRLRGLSEGNISIYKGIPYAAPPVGDNRWRPPQPIHAWKGVRNAVKFGADCVQAGFRSPAGFNANNSSEDCLFLNIWTPSSASPRIKLPVIVWIHGGA